MMPKRSAKPDVNLIRAAQVKWLAVQDLIGADEARQMLSAFRFPNDFKQRVFAKFGKAEAATQAAGIASERVISGAPEERIALSHRCFDGPYPPRFDDSNARYLPIELHVAQSGKLYVGPRQTTLMLNDDAYFDAVSSPASAWITPVFAEAPGELKLPGTVAVLFANGATLFSHWMFDLLPKIEILRRAGWTDDRVDYYVVNAFRDDFQHETFDRLGIPRRKVISLSGAVISASRLLIPSDIRSGFRTPAWAAQFIRSLFQSRSHSTNSAGRSRLYISRAKARRRTITNRRDIEPLLESRGFQTVFAEDMTITQCAELVAQAGHIFAPHGAGATNVVFAQPGVRILESYSAHIAPEAWLLAHSRVAGTHFLLVGDDKEGQRPWEAKAFRGLSEAERNLADYALRPEDVKNALDYLLEN
jgi:capsular polysaccharide biosynthesis protein